MYGKAAVSPLKDVLVGFFNLHLFSCSTDNNSMETTIATTINFDKCHPPARLEMFQMFDLPITSPVIY